MSIALVSGSKATASPWGGAAVSPRAISPAATVTSGNKAFLWVFFSGTATAPTVSDNSTQAGAANTWTLLRLVSGTGAMALFYCDVSRNILSTDTVSVAWTGGSMSVQMNLSEWTGCQTGAPIEVTAGNTGTSSTPHGGATSAGTTAGELMVAGTSIASAQAASVGTDNQGTTMTSLHAPATGSSRSSIVEYELIPTSSLSYNPGMTYVGSAAFVGLTLRVAALSAGSLTVISPPAIANASSPGGLAISHTIASGVASASGAPPNPNVIISSVPPAATATVVVMIPAINAVFVLDVSSHALPTSVYNSLIALGYTAEMAAAVRDRITQNAQDPAR